MLELNSEVKFISVESDVFWLAIVKVLEMYFYFVLFIVSESPSIVDLYGFSADNVEKCSVTLTIDMSYRCTHPLLMMYII